MQRPVLWCLASWQTWGPPIQAHVEALRYNILLDWVFRVNRATHNWQCAFSHCCDRERSVLRNSPNGLPLSARKKDSKRRRIPDRLIVADLRVVRRMGPRKLLDQFMQGGHQPMQSFGAASCWPVFRPLVAGFEIHSGFDVAVPRKFCQTTHWVRWFRGGLVTPRLERHFGR